MSNPVLKQRSGICVCFCAWDGLGKIQHPPTSQIISHRAKKALRGPFCHIALFLPTGTEQDKTAQLNSHFALSQPAVDCWIPLGNHRSMHTAAAAVETPHCGLNTDVYWVKVNLACKRTLPVLPPTPPGHSAKSVLTPHALHLGNPCSSCHSHLTYCCASTVPSAVIYLVNMYTAGGWRTSFKRAKSDCVYRFCRAP